VSHLGVIGGWSVFLGPFGNEIWESFGDVDQDPIIEPRQTAASHMMSKKFAFDTSIEGLQVIICSCNLGYENTDRKLE
jgi:hypothetical protein